MKKVTIKNGKYYSQVINGTFELLAGFESVDSAPQGFNGRVKINLNDQAKKVWVNSEDIEVSDGPIPTFVPATDDELRTAINKRFEVMSMMGDGMCHGNIRSLLISGAAGIGKTYTLEKKLNAANDNGQIDFTMIKGKISAIGLYIHLWENQDADCVTVLDDVDVFDDMDTLNVLKAALDTGDKRLITWGTASSYLDERGIDKQFEFKGSIAFITNTNIDKEINKGGKMAPHLNALVSRSVLLDLKVHTNREIMLRVEDVVAKTSMLQDKGLTESQTVEVIEYMKDNCENLRNVSLRTALHLADFIQTNPENWQTIADVTMVK